MPLAILVSWVVFETFPATDQFIRILVAVALMSTALWLAETVRSRAVGPASAVTS